MPHGLPAGCLAVPCLLAWWRPSCCRRIGTRLAREEKTGWEQTPRDASMPRPVLPNLVAARTCAPGECDRYFATLHAVQYREYVRTPRDITKEGGMRIGIGDPPLQLGCDGSYRPKSTCNSIPHGAAKGKHQLCPSKCFVRPFVAGTKGWRLGGIAFSLCSSSRHEQVGEEKNK